MWLKESLILLTVFCHLLGIISFKWQSLVKSYPTADGQQVTYEITEPQSSCVEVILTPGAVILASILGKSGI